MSEFSYKNTSASVFKDTSSFIYTGNDDASLVWRFPKPLLGSYNDNGVRISINPSYIKNPGSIITLEFWAYYVYACTFQDVFIGLASGTSDFAFIPGTQTQVLFDGGNSYGVAYGPNSADIPLVSDPVVFNVSGADRLLISFNINGNPGSSYKNLCGTDSYGLSGGAYQSDPSSEFPQSGSTRSFRTIALYEIVAQFWTGAGQIGTPSVVNGLGGVYEDIKGSTDPSMGTPSTFVGAGESRVAVTGATDVSMGNPSELPGAGFAEIFGAGTLSNPSTMLSESREYVFFYNF